MSSGCDFRSWVSLGCYIYFLLELGTGEREAISLAPWLQPGGQVLQNDS
jgi:hypothetical protein